MSRILDCFEYMSIVSEAERIDEGFSEALKCPSNFSFTANMDRIWPDRPKIRIGYFGENNEFEIQRGNE